MGVALSVPFAKQELQDDIIVIREIGLQRWRKSKSVLESNKGFPEERSIHLRPERSWEKPAKRRKSKEPALASGEQMGKNGR